MTPQTSVPPRMHRADSRRAGGSAFSYIGLLVCLTILAVVVDGFFMGFNAARLKGFESMAAVAVGLGSALFVFAGFAGLGWLITRRAGGKWTQKGSTDSISTPPPGDRR